MALATPIVITGALVESVAPVGDGIHFQTQVAIPGQAPAINGSVSISGLSESQAQTLETAMNANAPVTLTFS